MNIKTNVDYGQEKLLKNLRAVLNSKFIFIEPEYLNPHQAITADRISFNYKELDGMPDDVLKNILKDQFTRVLFVALETKGLHMLPGYQFAFCSKVEDDFDIDTGNFILTLEIYIHCK